MKKITSTTLTLKTREVIEQVRETNEPVVVYTYNQPRVVVVDYDEWEGLVGKKASKKKEKTLGDLGIIDDIKKLDLKADVPQNDTTAYIRKMRDEE